MKKVLVFMLLLVIGLSAMAQQRIQLRSVDKAECVSSDMTSLRASFSFSTIEAEDYQSEKGTFSRLSLPNTVIGGNEGDPQIPVFNELIAVPFGATPRIEITSFSTTEYRLADYDMKTLVPRQPSLRKDQRPEDVPFVMNEAAYQSNRTFRNTPKAVVEVVGTMRGVRLGKMTIEPVSYDPVNNTIRVFNDIEVTVHFDGANVRATKQKLVDTYSPYFDVVYAQLFNSRMTRDAYSEHPDLYTTPVKMIVITSETYANNATFQEWVNWKKQKGIYTTVYTTATTGTTAANIKSFIRNKYNTEAPTFVVIVGDVDAVTYSLSSSTTSKVTDLYYSTTDDNDLWPEMFLSRMPISTTKELENLLNKIMTYEKYTMADPSYLSNVLLIAGSDGTWNPRVGQPTINYAADNYFNTAHGFVNVYKYLDSYTNCYNNMNTGIGFANYTAHGGETGWSGPSFSVSNANSLTNNDKYFWAMGNCCLAANWGYNGTCLAEALLRGESKGAFGYIGSCPETYWWEDYYFGVGATTVTNATPSMSQTQTGAYDGMFMDNMYNTLNSVPFLGNIAVAYAHANSYTSSVTDKYYWEAYHTLGDGSVMPYHVQPAANNVSHSSTIAIGVTSFAVSADAGSYVSITKNNEILGVAQVPASGTVNVPISGLNSAGDVMIVVTRQQRQPYITTIQAISANGPYISLESYTPNTAHVGDNTALSLTFKNVGTQATSGTATVTLSSSDASFSVNNRTFNALAANATTTVSGFQFSINAGVADGTPVSIHYSVANGSNTWEGNFNVTAGEAVLEYAGMSWDGGFEPGQTLTLNAKFKNTGHYQATNAIAQIASTSNYLSIANSTVNVGTIAVGQEVTVPFTVTISANCPESAIIPVTFMMTADGNLSVTGNETLKNACNIYFDLSDTYGDGWNGASLNVSFSDGTAAQTLTIGSGNSASYTIEVGNGTHVTLTWVSGSYDGECSFTVNYEGDLVIYSQTARPTAGVLYEFDCNCAAASQTFMVTVTSSNTAQGTVSGGGEFGFGQSCTVTATPSEGYMFNGWTMNGEMVSSASPYTFIVNSDMNLVANFAEGNQIGSGDATSDFLPSYSYYKYGLSQQIYTPQELGSAGTITGIALYNAGAEKTRSYNFYMKATTKSSFTSATDWVTVSASDQVYSGSVTMVANDWTWITFDTPFEYNGVSNLILVADDNSGAWTSSPHMSCRVFDATSQALYVYTDDSDYDPSNPSSYSGTVLSVKNQIRFAKEIVVAECLAPTDLAATEINHQSAMLNWNGEADSWKVAYKTSTASQFTEVPVNTNSYSLTGLLPETSYTVKVAAVCGDETVWSEPISFTTLQMPCAAPTALTAANVTSTTASLSWTETGTATSWVLQYGTDDAFANGTYTEKTVNGTPAYELVGLIAETQYYARVKSACSANNQSDWSNTCTFLPSIYVVIGSGTGTNNFLPTNVNNKYSMTQQIYTVEELGEAGDILSLDFYKNNTVVASRKLDIYIVNTDKSSFTGSNDWIPVTAANKVFSGTVSFNDNSWTTITLDRPFRYEGTSNVAIVVDDNTGLVKSSTPFLVFPASNQAIRISSNTTNYNVVTASNYTGTVLSSKNQMRIVKGELGPFCPAPTEVAVSVTGRHSAVVTWTENGEATSWMVAYRSATENRFAEVEVSENTYTMTGLSIETNYVVKVRPVCEDATESWSEEKTFTTEGCYTISPDAQESGKWTEDFDSYTTSTATETGVQPDCWEVLIPDATLTSSTKPQLYRGYATSGSYSLRMKNRCLYAMPSLDEDVPVNALQMKFNLRQPNSIYRLQVGVVNENGEFKVVKTINNASTGKEPVTVDFTDYSGGGHRIAFRNTLANGSNLAYSYNYIDDIEIGYANSCEIAVLQYTENFDSYTTTTATETGVQPDCWEVITEDVALTEATMPQLYRGYATSGSYSLRMKNRCVYAMRPLSANINVGDLTMTFNLRQAKSIYRLQVGVLNENGEFTVVKTLKCSNTSNMEAKTVNFSGYTGNRIAFRNTLVPGTGMSTDYLDYSVNYIDNIHLDYTAVSKQDVNDENMIDANADMENIVVYPNPTTGELYIDAVGIQKVECYNQMGQLVRVYDNVLNSIALNDLSQGIYTLRITVPQGVAVRKVVKR